MTFKLITFALILIGIAVLGMRGYRAAVRRFEAEAGVVDAHKAVAEVPCGEASAERPSTRSGTP